MHANTWLTGNRSPPGFAGPAPARTPSDNFLIYTKKLATPWLRLNWHGISKPLGKIPKPLNGISPPLTVFAERIGKRRRKKRQSDLARKLRPLIPRIRPAILCWHRHRLLLRSRYPRTKRIPPRLKLRMLLLNRKPRPRILP